MKGTGYLLLGLLLASCSKQESTLELSMEEYRDRMKAAWVGQMAGVGWGLPTEFDYIGRMIPEEEVPQWTPGMVNQQGNDDLYVEMTFLASMEKHGTGVSQRQAGIDFANTQYGLWAANKAGRENLRSGIAPPESGHPRFSANCEDIDYQIEADYSGIIAPGMPGVAIRLGEKFGRLMNYGDGVYAGQFVGGMYAAAYFTGDINEIIDRGLACIPEASNYAACVRDVRDWHREYPDDWTQCWERIMDKYYRTLDHQPFHQKEKDAWVGIDAKINGAFIVLGLLYGEGDMDSTILYSMRCGLDSDCNPSNAAGILATTIGYRNLPEKFKSGLDPDRKFSHTDYDFNDLLRVSEAFTRAFVEEVGGRIALNDAGEEVMYIRSLPAQPPEFKPAYDPGPADQGNRFSQEELDQLQAWSYLSFQPVMEATYPGWRVYNAGKESSLQLIGFKGKEEVLAITPMSAGRGAILEYVPDSPDVSDDAPGTGAGEIRRAVLRMDVAAGEGKAWQLSVRINAPGGRVTLDEEVSGTGNWRSVELPFAYEGQIPRIRVMANSSAEGEINRACLAGLSVKMEQ